MTFRFLFVVVITIWSLTCISQSKSYFEGTITYQFTFKADKIPNPNDALTPYLGKGSTLFFKEGNYRHEYDGGLFEYDIYNKQDNKLYLKKRNNDTLYWTDCS